MSASDFLGNLRHGWLHEYLGIPADQKIPLSLIDTKLDELKAVENKTPDQLHAERALNLAKQFHHWRRS